MLSIPEATVQLPPIPPPKPSPKKDQWFQQGSREAKALLAAMPVLGVLGWGVWAYLATGQEPNSFLFPLLWFGGAYLYKCPTEVAKRMPSWAPTALIVAVPAALILAKYLDAELIVLIFPGFVIMGAGLHSRISEVQREKD